jgi:hypothetical protein
VQMISKQGPLFTKRLITDVTWIKLQLMQNESI